MSTIHDFGQKVGGARKDQTIKRTVKTQDNTTKDERPVWRRAYEIRKLNHPTKPFHIYRNGSYMRWNCATEEEAEAVLPGIEAARLYRIFRDRKSSEDNPRYTLWRQVGKSWVEVSEPKEGFTSVSEGEQYIIEHALELLAFRFTPPERPFLEEIQRTGLAHYTGNVIPAQFQQTFKFRGGEFGHWNHGKTGQISLNHAYEALHDLATVLGVPPSVLSLNNELSIAFGARGHGGKNAVQAHYERAYAVMNLTKMHGAGALAHEWLHGFDHWLARLDGKSKSGREETGKFKTLPREVDYLSHGASRSNSKLPLALIDAAKQLMETISYKTITRARSIEVAERQHKRARERVAEELDRLTEQWENGRYTKRFKPPTEEQKTAWQEATTAIKNNNPGDKTSLDASQSYLGLNAESYAQLDVLCRLYKETHNRSLTSKSDPDSTHARLRSSIRLQQNAEVELQKAQAGESETVRQHTDYYNEARAIDKTRTDAYWATPHELAARAFEAWVYDEIIANQQRSDYLVYGVENWYYLLEGWKPYPEGEERKAINEAFRHFFQVAREALPSFKSAQQEIVRILPAPPPGPEITTRPINFKTATQLSLF